MFALIIHENKKMAVSANSTTTQHFCQVELKKKKKWHSVLNKVILGTCSKNIFNLFIEDHNALTRGGKDFWVFKKSLKGSLGVIPFPNLLEVGTSYTSYWDKFLTFWVFKRLLYIWLVINILIICLPTDYSLCESCLIKFIFLHCS